MTKRCGSTSVLMASPPDCAASRAPLMTGATMHHLRARRKPGRGPPHSELRPMAYPAAPPRAWYAAHEKSRGGAVVVRTFASLALGALALAPPAAAQPYPSRPVTIVAPYAAGGGADPMARLKGQKLAQRAGPALLGPNTA